MAEGEMLKLGTAQGWAVTPADDKHTAVVFKVGPDTIGAILSNVDLSRYAERILQEAIKAAQTQTPVLPDGETITSNPVPVSGLAVIPGRTPTEALLAIRAGNLTLTFSVDPTILRGMCTDLLPKLQPLPKPSSH